ncbi:MAG: HlyD family efflux transporter periplasmic adaptor subunit [Deltaproteobacteria bacterium]|nr:HlyD family efflux transporter periplasmic adaptor subunit [Deltaproteobacteria bacterium]
MMKYRLNPAFFLLSLIFITLFFCSLPGFTSEPEKEPGKEPAFNLCTARAALRTTVLRGYTRARWRRFLTCEETGRCLEVRAEMGDQIGADGIYAVLDTTFIDLELKANQAASARLTNQMAYWQREVKRYRQLSGSQAVSENKVQELELQYDQARLSLDELKAQAALLAERRRRCVITAPPGWQLLERSLEPGQWSASGRVVGEVGDYRTLLVPFALTLPEYEWLKKESAGKALSLLLPGADNKSTMIPARLLHVSPAFEQKTRKIAVELEVAAGLPEMRGGVMLELAIVLPEAGNVVEVPAAAVIERYGADWLTRADGTEVKVVKLGHAGASALRVTGNHLQAGDRFRCR